MKAKILFLLSLVLLAFPALVNADITAIYATPDSLITNDTFMWGGANAANNYGFTNNTDSYGLLVYAYSDTTNNRPGAWISFDFESVLPPSTIIDNITLALHGEKLGVASTVMLYTCGVYVEENHFNGQPGNASYNSPSDSSIYNAGNTWYANNFSAGEYLGEYYDNNADYYINVSLNVTPFQEMLDGTRTFYGIIFQTDGAGTSIAQNLYTKEDGGWSVEIGYHQDINDPTQVFWEDESPANNTHYNSATMPDPLSFYFEVNDTNVSENIAACYLQDDSQIYDTLLSPEQNTNYSLNVTGGFAAEGNYNMTIMCDDGTSNSTSISKLIVYDITPPDIPLIDAAFPLEDNSSRAHYPAAVPLNISCGDLNELWSFEINLTASNGSMWGYYIEDLNVTNYTYDTVTDFSFFPNGTILTDVTCYDSHTKNKIGDYDVIKNLITRTLRYDTGDNIITIQAENLVDSIGSTKKTDRYNFDFDFKYAQGEYSFLVYATEGLNYQADSKYAGHFVSGKEWIDFVLPDKNAKYTVTKINSYTYRVRIKTSGKKLSFSSTGQLNKAEAHAQFELGNTPPTTPSIISPVNSTMTDNATIDLSCDGSIDPDADTIYYDYFTGTDPSSLSITCSNVGTLCSYNTTVNGFLYWNCAANDTYASSNLTSIRYVRAETWDIIDANYTVPTLIYEGVNTYFYINASWNELRYDSASAMLNFSGTSYVATATQYDNYTSFAANLTLPDVSAIQNWSWNWVIDLSYPNGSTSQNNSYSGNTEIIPIYLTIGCTGNATAAVALNFSFAYENNWSEFYGDVDDWIDLDANLVLYNEVVAMNDTQSFSFANISDFTVCIPEGAEFKLDGIIDYIAPLYDRRQYYFFQNTVTNQTQNITLYLLDITLGSGISISVTDSTGNGIETAYIYVYRYDASIDDYKLVSMGLTDTDGAEYLYLRKYDAFYKFVVMKDGIIIYEDADKRKISEDSLVLRTGVVSMEDLLNKFNAISYNLYNTSTQIILEYSDSAASASKYCLSVYKSNDTYICATCLTASSGTITCDLTGYGTYIARGWAIIEDVPRPFGTYILEIAESIYQDFGKTGLFGAFLIILVLGSIGAWLGKTSGTVIGTLLGLALSKLLFLLYMNWGVFLGLMAVGVVIIAWSRN